MKLQGRTQEAAARLTWAAVLIAKPLHVVT
jgi:hypothetical protein